VFVRHIVFCFLFLSPSLPLTSARTAQNEKRLLPRRKKPAKEKNKHKRQTQREMNTGKRGTERKLDRQAPPMQDVLDSALSAVDSILTTAALEADMDAAGKSPPEKIAALRAYLLGRDTHDKVVKTVMNIAKEMDATPTQALAAVKATAVLPGETWTAYKATLPAHMFPLPSYRRISDVPSHMLPPPLSLRR
jgi:hypothetical protein